MRTAVASIWIEADRCSRFFILDFSLEWRRTMKWQNDLEPAESDSKSKTNRTMESDWFVASRNSQTGGDKTRAIICVRVAGAMNELELELDEWQNENEKHAAAACGTQQQTGTAYRTGVIVFNRWCWQPAETNYYNSLANAKWILPSVSQ